MNSISGIKHSIKAIKDTRQITSAMKLISTSKMQKSIQKYESNSIYFNRVRSAMKDILIHTHDISHPYFHQYTEGKPTFVVIAADKGLCGGYNHNILAFAQQEIDKYDDKFIVTIGQEAGAYFNKKNIPVDAEYIHLSHNPTLSDATSLAIELCEMYRRHDINAINIIFTRFYSSVKQAPAMINLLPVTMDDFFDVEVESIYNAELSYHPSPNEVFDVLIMQYIIGVIYGALVQATASENCQRMMAMDNSSKNANEMIEKLSIKLNRARQQSITEDITEIVSAMDALNG